MRVWSFVPSACASCHMCSGCSVVQTGGIERLSSSLGFSIDPESSYPTGSESDEGKEPHS